LIAVGIETLRARQCPFVVVVGHPEYYPRFGFVPASRHGVRCQWEVPDDAFILLPLDRSGLQGMAGIARYRDEFAVVT
jgi:putative acetyltransferase